VPGFPDSISVLAQARGSIALDLLAILAAAALVSLLFRKVPSVTIPGFLIAGAIIGPHSLGMARGAADAESVASLSTVLLMFTIGLHLDIGGLRGGLAPAILITVLSIIGTTALGWPVARALGLPAPAAMSVAMALSISSTAVVLRILEQKRELHRVHGRLSFGILLIQDLAALVMMALVPVLAAWAKGVHATAPLPGQPGLPPGVALFAKASFAIGGIGALIVVGRLAVPRMLRAAAGSGETLLVVSSALALAAAVATAGLGFSPELGAFLAGFLLASTPFRYQLAGQLVPLRDLFLAVFFTALGLDLPLGLVVHNWWLVLAGVIATVLIKFGVIGATSWLCGASAAVAAYVGLALAQGSEFSLVLLAQARSKGVLDADQAGDVIAVVVVTLILTPGLINSARWAARHASRFPTPPWRIGGPSLNARDDDRRGVAPDDPDRVAPADAAPGSRAIIAGFGPVGRAVADNLQKRGVKITVIELNPRTVERQYGLGRSIIYGDASNPEVLDRAGLTYADAVILTMPDEEAVLRACRLIRSIRPDIFIAARLNALSKALQAMQLGADHTVVEEMATADAMAREVMLKLQQRESGEDIGPRLYEFET
jgi:Kef-type K+ transport system membrane component KefB